MNLKNVAWSLMLGGSILAVGCGGDDDASATDPSGSDPSGATMMPIDVPSCDVASDTDTMTRAFHINTLEIPASNKLGFNLDGLSTTTTSDVAGCKKVDGQPGGLDNSLALIIMGLAPTLNQAGVNINEELQAAVTAGDIDLTLTINKWNGTPTDACVGVVISGDSAGAPIASLSGSAALSSSVIEAVAFPNSLTIVPTFQLKPDGGLGMCAPGEGCVTKMLPITISGARAHIVFNAGMTALEFPEVAASRTNANSTMLGGQVLYEGTAGEGAFKPGLEALVSGIDPSLTTLVNNIFAGFLDLDTTPSLTACTQVSGSTISADSFSAAILVAGAQP